MTETPTPHPETSVDQAAEDAKWMQQAAEAARRNALEETSATDTQNEEPQPNARNRIVGASIAAVAGAALVTTAGVGAVQAPEFSDETKTVTVESGDGLYDLADEIQGVEGVNRADAVAAIESNPVNIDPLKDGLQPGDSIEVPIKVEK